MDGDVSSRKRPRSLSPGPGGSRSTTTGRTTPSRNDLYKGSIVAARVLNKETRNETLNALLELTLKHEPNYVLDGEDLLQALVTITYETLDWTLPSATDGWTSEGETPRFQSLTVWESYPTSTCEAFANHCTKILETKCMDTDRFKPFEAILVILRNLSFLSANHRLMAYSPAVLSLLIAALYESSSSSNLSSDDDISTTLANTNTNMSKLALPAIHALQNLAPYLDVTGQKLLADKLFFSPGMELKSQEELPLVPNAPSYGQVANGSWGFGGLWLAKRLDPKEDIVQDVSKELLLEYTQDHVVTVWSIFPALGKLLLDPLTPRQVVMVTLELIQELIGQARVSVVVVGSADNDDNNDDTSDSKLATMRSIFCHLPDSILQRMARLLYVPRLGPDAMDYLDPVRNIVTRVTVLKLLQTYDMTIDNEIRDRVLDVLVPLMELDSPRMARRLTLKEPNTKAPTSIRTSVYDALLPIVTSKAGRADAPQLAMQLLKELSKAPEASVVGLPYLQSRVLTLAARDPRMAHLALNYLYHPWGEGGGGGGGVMVDKPLLPPTTTMGEMVRPTQIYSSIVKPRNITPMNEHS